MNIDKIDQQILYALDVDCRASLSSIAKKIRKSPQYTKYRFDRLKEERIIRGVTFHTGLNSNEAFAFIKLRGCSIVREKLLIDYLIKHPNTRYVYTSDNIFDLIVLIHNPIEMKNTLFDSWPEIIEILFSLRMGCTIHSKLFFSPNSELVSVNLLNEKQKSSFENNLLAALKRHPFAHLRGISSELGVSYDRVTYAMKKNAPYIKSSLQLSTALISNMLLLLDIRKNRDLVVEYAKQHPHIVRTDTLIGEYDTLLHFQSMKETPLQNIIKELLYKFSDEIGTHLRVELTELFKEQGDNS